jgi:3',5'-cyclic AMP phosphodiesterase CpdA
LLFLLAGCSNDLLGLFASDDFQKREAVWNTFVFPEETERSLSLTVPYSFLVITDTHIQGDDTNRFEDIGDIVKQNGDSFVVVTGDITQSGKREELQNFIDIAGSFGVPCYPVLGNHDIFFNNWKNWKELIGSATYRIDSGSTTLLVLDTANAVFCSRQLDWLEKQLRSSGKNTFVFTHCNLFIENAGDIQQLTDIRERARILSMLDGRCTAMFTGHVHNRIIRKAGGVRYIIIEDFKRSGTYCRVYVTEDGMRYEFLSVK